MNGRFALGALLLTLLVGTAVGVLSYNAGVSHGLAIAPAASGTAAVPAMPYGYYRPWGWGFGWGFAPLFFLGFWWFLMFGIFRGLWWGGGMYRHGGYGPGWRTRAFDEWHRRAHEEMNKTS
jgi:hypothetical protein